MAEVHPIEQQFEATEHGADEPPETPPESDSIPTPEPEPSAPPSPRKISVRGQEIDEDDVASLLEFQQWAQSNPDKMQAFASYLRGEAQFVKGEPEPETPKAPEIDWDVVDPNVRAAYEAQQARLDALQEKVGEWEGPIQSIQQRQYAQAQQEANEALDAAASRIMDRFKLTDDEMDDLADEAARLNIVPGLRQQGMAPQAALETALETAFWRNEKYREKVIDEQVSSRSANGRREKAGKISGTSGAAGDGIGSAQPVPTNEAERRTAMAAEIAEALRGTP
jgi:hypothetical protein